MWSVLTQETGEGVQQGGACSSISGDCMCKVALEQVLHDVDEYLQGLMDPSHDSDVCQYSTISAHDGCDEAPQVAFCSVHWPDSHGQPIIDCSRLFTLYSSPAM